MRPYYLKKEKLARRIKAHKLKSQKTMVLEQLTLGIVTIKNLSRRKSTITVIPTLALIKFVNEVPLLRTG